MEGLIQPILNGILLGGLYAVIAIGMSTMFGIVKLVNLAHGDLMILSSFLSLCLISWLGVNPFLSLLQTTLAGKYISTDFRRIYLVQPVLIL